MSGLTRLEIKSGILDFGSTVVRLEHVASVRRGERRPLRIVGVILLLVALGLAGFEALFNMAAFSLTSGGSVRIWAACALAGIGLFSLVYAQRCLFIATAGGDRLVLRIANGDFAGKVVDELRHAMAAPVAPRHVIIDLAAQTISAGEFVEPSYAPADPHRVQGAQPLPHAQLQGPHGPHAAGLPHAAQHAPHQGGVRPPEWHDGTLNGAPPNGHLNGSAGHPPGAAADARRELPEARGLGLGQPAGGMMRAQGPGPGSGPGFANGLAPQPHQSPVQAQRTAPPMATRELAQLMDFVARSPIQHKDALIDLLRVVEDHQLSGRTSRDDAVAHWKSFSEYVGQYLGSVDGLPQLTERAGRSLGR